MLIISYCMLIISFAHQNTYHKDPGLGCNKIIRILKSSNAINEDHYIIYDLFTNLWIVVALVFSEFFYL